MITTIEQEQEAARAQAQADIDLFVFKCIKDFDFFAHTCLSIKTKNEGLQPFKFNKAQQYLNKCVNDMIEKYGKARIIIVKGRQQGLSTWVQARGYWKTSQHEGIKAFILTHEEAATKNLFEMAKRFHDHAPADIKPFVKKSNRSEMVFNDLESQYSVGTAKTGDTGRSQTIQFFHGSEVAYWRAAEEISSGAMEGIPEAEGTEVYLESTAAGFGGYFHSMWQNAVYPNEEPHGKWNGYIRVFIPWTWQDEYRTPVNGKMELTEEEKQLVQTFKLDDEQIQFRRTKIAKMSNDVARFQRDYPLTSEEAFNSSLTNILIQSEKVLKARAKGRLAYYQPMGNLVLGVDVAREGDDSTALVLRQGRIMHWYRRYNKLDNMEVAGIVINAIRQFRVDFVCIDSTGGYGAGVYDRMIELGYGSKVTAVNFASRAFNDEAYKNRRAEMWIGIREWLEEGAQMPDRDEIQLDLCSVTYKHDSTGERLQLESKAEMKKRGIKSPDIGDALALTFARPRVNLSGAGESFDPEQYFNDYT
jgi:hypothetical protein